MSFPRYDRYKDSDIEWGGEVPAHWSMKRLKFISMPTVGVVVDPSSYLSEDGLPFIYGGDIREGVIDWRNARRISRADSGRNAKTLLSSGDLLTVRVGAPGVTAVVPPECEGGNCASVMHIARGGFNSFWLCYAMNSPLVRYQVKVVQYGAAQEQFNIAHALNFWIPTPPIAEQDQIATLLDCETTKIDGLMEAQRRLIELLKEKRQAVISHAVTKGLNPNAPMKDSGIGWLGEIPENWKVKRIKYVIRNLEQGWSPQCENYPAEDGEWAVLKVGCVNGGIFNANENKALPPELSAIPALSIRAGDVLISRANTRELVGSAAIATTDFPHHLLCDKLYRLRLRSELCMPGYLAMFLGTPHARWEIELAATGASSSMVNIGQSTVTEMFMPLPTTGEQQEIASFIGDETAKLDELTAEANRAISLLQERRTALISAAVTGKIDIRGDIAVSSAVEKPYTAGFARQLLAAEILHDCYDHPTTGRVKLQKLIHLCEYVAEINEVNGSYLRKAAGPFDNKVMFGIASGLSKQKWFSEVKDGNRTIYRPLDKAGEHKKYLARWESKMPKIHEVLGLLGKAATQQCEIVSTLYAAWNDLLIEGQVPSDKEIIHEASDQVRWHENKAKIPSDKWPKALKWMRDHGLVPKGYGNHTRHDAVAKEPV